MHVATRQAKAAATKRKNGQPDFLTTDERANAARGAAEAYRQWIAAGLTPEQIALRVYEPLLKGQASKAVAAQFLSERLECTLKVAERLGHSESVDRWLRSRLPSYIVDAIDFVSVQA